VSKTILEVDDSPDVREMVSYILAQEGFSVITAEDGEAALQLIRKQIPDLIITDIQMPRVDGIEMIKRVRDWVASKNVPIVVMSSFGGRATQEALDAGADKSNPKPMVVDYFLKIVRQLLD
jgi:CheY-like chemotaxis protein